MAFHRFGQDLIFWWWFGFRFKPIFDIAPAALKSGQKWPKYKPSNRVTFGSVLTIYEAKFLFGCGVSKICRSWHGLLRCR